MTVQLGNLQHAQQIDRLAHVAEAGQGVKLAQCHHEFGLVVLVAVIAVRCTHIDATLVLSREPFFCLLQTGVGLQ